MFANQAEFDHGLTLLRESVSLLAGAVETRFLDGWLFDPDPEVSGITGSALEEPLKAIVSRLCDVMQCIDLMQQGLGLPPGEAPRFRRFLERRS